MEKGDKRRNLEQKQKWKKVINEENWNRNRNRKR